MAAQLTPLRPWLQQNLAGTLKRLSDAGFQAVSVGPLVGSSTEELAKLLGEQGLETVAYRVNFHDLTSRFAGTVGDARALGASWIIVSHLRLDEYGDGWVHAGGRMKLCGQELWQEGLGLAYQNQDNELGQDGDSTAIEKLLQGAGSELKVDLDAGWIKRGGQDPSMWLDKLSEHVAMLHVSGAGEDIADEADGWSPIISGAVEKGVPWLLLELDQCQGDAVDCYREGAHYLASLGVEA